MLLNILVGIMTSRRRYDVTSVAALIPRPQESPPFLLFYGLIISMLLNRFNSVFGILIIIFTEKSNNQKKTIKLFQKY